MCVDSPLEMFPMIVAQFLRRLPEWMSETLRRFVNAIVRILSAERA